MLNVPTGSDEVVNFARCVVGLTVPVPSTVVPFLKVTVPLGEVVPGSPAYALFMDRVKEFLIKQGITPAAAGHAAVGGAYQMMLRQANMLSYKNRLSQPFLVVFLL